MSSERMMNITRIVRAARRAGSIALGFASGLFFGFLFAIICQDFKCL